MSNVQTKNSKIDIFENKPVLQALSIMAVPTIVSQLITLIYNIADLWYIGQTDNPYMVAATSLVATIFLLATAIANIFGVGGCALVRLLNHDGYRIYNVRIDNLIETSSWSENDAPVAQNPDLIIRSDENGNIYHERWLTPGEEGYRCEAAILIGESYWYNTSKAQHGDTFGISVSNVMTHARYGLFLNNTLLDSSFDNIRMFGNGYAAAYFGEGLNIGQW